MRRAESVTELGDGAYDGEGAILDYDGEHARLRWRDAEGCWIGEPQPIFALRDSWIIENNAVVPNTWVYLYAPSGNPGNFGQSCYSWNPRPIRKAGAAFDAGLRLEEHMIADCWVFDPGCPYDLATVLYPISDDDGISGAILPSDHVSLIHPATVTLRRLMRTGWVQSPIATTGGKDSLQPHLYHRYTAAPSTMKLEYLLARWRWKGAP